MDAIILIDVNVTVCFQDVCAFVDDCAIAIEYCQSFLKDHLACKGLNGSGRIQEFFTKTLALYDLDHP